jgi:hypothetical protein
VKVVNTIITVCFMIVFAAVFYSIDYNITTVINKKEIEEQIFAKELSKRFQVGSEMMIQIPQEKIEVISNNEYVKGAIGAAIGWVVKSICEFIFGLLKKGWSVLI